MGSLHHTNCGAIEAPVCEVPSATAVPLRLKASGQ
jgi:hypothetical protein